MHIKNSVIVVTSASSVLGSALSEHFAQIGAKLVLVDHNYQNLVETYQRCKATSQDVHYCFVEDYSHQSINEILNFVEVKFAQAPDVLVTHWPNQPLPSLTEDNPIERFTHNIAHMASTLFSFVQMTTERMREQGKEGVIINIVTNTEEAENKGYDNTAFMVSGFTQSWAKELGPYHIRVGAVLPTSQSIHNQDRLSEILDEYVRNTEYIVENEYFSGRVVSA